MMCWGGGDEGGHLLVVVLFAVAAAEPNEANIVDGLAGRQQIVGHRDDRDLEVRNQVRDDTRDVGLNGPAANRRDREHLSADQRQLWSVLRGVLSGCSH